MQKAAKSTPSGVRLSRLRRPSNQNCLDEFTSPDECGQTNSSKIVRASFKLDHVRRRMSSDELQLLGVKFAICPELTPDSSNYLHLRFTTEYGRRAGWNLQSIRTRPDVSPSTVDGRVGVLEFAINCASRQDEMHTKFFELIVSLQTPFKILQPVRRPSMDSRPDEFGWIADSTLPVDRTSNRTSQESTPESGKVL